jgi:hypothetical protein
MEYVDDFTNYLQTLHQQNSDYYFAPAEFCSWVKENHRVHWKNLNRRGQDCMDH